MLSAYRPRLRTLHTQRREMRGLACILKGARVFLSRWVSYTTALQSVCGPGCSGFRVCGSPWSGPVGAFLELSNWSPWLAAQDPSPHARSTVSPGQVPL